MIGLLGAGWWAFPKAAQSAAALDACMGLFSMPHNAIPWIAGWVLLTMAIDCVALIAGDRDED